MRAKDWLKGLAADRRGNALVVAATCIPLMIGAAALGVDTIYMALSKRQLQRSADSGALAGAYAIVQSKDASAAVTRDLQLNNSIALTGAPTVENAPTVGSYAGNVNAVRVALTATVPMAFWSVFSSSSATIKAEATASVTYNAKWCMLSLEDGNTTGISFTGSADIDLGCGIATNSKAASAITAGGSSKVKATPLSAQGGVPSSSHFLSPTTLLPYSPKQADPFATLPLPAIPAGESCPVLSVKSNEPAYTVTAQTDKIYCFKGMDVKGTVNLQPGIYYIDSSSFSIGAQGVINGTDVTIILTSDNAVSNSNSIAGFDIAAGATVNLSASKTGTYEGVLFYQDPRAALGNTIHINGNTDSFLEGAFYFPRAYMTFNGTAGMETRCIQLIARRLEFSGSSSVDNTCPTDGGAQSFDLVFVRLVA